VYAGKRQDEHSAHDGPHREPVGTAK